MGSNGPPSVVSIIDFIFIYSQRSRREKWYKLSLTVFVTSTAPALFQQDVFVLPLHQGQLKPCSGIIHHCIFMAAAEMTKLINHTARKLRLINYP